MGTRIGKHLGKQDKQLRQSDIEFLHSFLSSAQKYASLLDKASPNVRLRHAAITRDSDFLISPAMGADLTLFEAAPSMAKDFSRVIPLLESLV